MSFSVLGMHSCLLLEMFALMTVRTHHQCMYAVTVAQFPHEHRDIRLVFAVIGSGLLYCTTRHQSVAIVVVALPNPSELSWVCNDYAHVVVLINCYHRSIHFVSIYSLYSF